MLYCASGERRMGSSRIEQAAATEAGGIKSMQNAFKWKERCIQHDAECQLMA
jgi:hypothetical protein